METISQERAQRFFRHLILSYRHAEKKLYARKKLEVHVAKLKDQYSNKKPSKQKVSQDFSKLQQQMQEVMDLEKGLYAHKQFLSEDVQQRIAELNSQFSTYVDSVQERKKKIQLLEDKIQKKFSQPSIVDDFDSSMMRSHRSRFHTSAIATMTPLQLRMKELEIKYALLEKKKLPAAQLKAIKQKIESLKRRV